ncbi:MFS transporter [Pseudoalteromonas sp. G4]|uniref:MFS transporter n=1 Tax=Pseudoalteromonas sp. G4 TaxID=2992761 RepID=UPI00237E0738|nr:MFS transporter [Pseudoalteromonas sp. G4]MDE3273262.1 MFS transporter [Pseudoalteromonas sp. G4]
MNKNVVLLAFCQGLITTGNILLVTISALVGKALSPSTTFITFPVAMQMLGLLVTTIPASLIMAKTGRKLGFSLGNSIGICGAVLGYFSLMQSEFWLFSFATFLIGIGIGFATLYRFAAIEASDKPAVAISTVMASGVVAAILGPNLAVWVNHHYPTLNYANAFIALAFLYSIALLLLQLVKFNEVSQTQNSGESRSLKTIATSPKFMTAVFIAMVSYTVMNLLMTATPLAMHRHGFDLAESALVIEWHVLGMFLPSFFSGKLIERFGQVTMMYAGIVLIALCCLVNLLGLSHWHFLAALFLLGVGWNFMFISATQMVSQTYLPHERAKAQATNEFLVFSMVTLSALSAGWLEATVGWQTLNLATLPILLITITWLTVYKIKQKHQLMSKPTIGEC